MYASATIVCRRVSGVRIFEVVGREGFGIDGWVCCVIMNFLVGVSCIGNKISCIFKYVGIRLLCWFYLLILLYLQRNSVIVSRTPRKL